MIKRTSFRCGLAVLVLVCCFCGKSKQDNNQATINRTIEQDKLYNQCNENIAALVKNIGVYKKYNPQTEVTLSAIEKEYGLKAVCPMTGAAYQYKSIVPQPGEEITNENIQAFYDGEAQRTYKIICPSHRLTVYGK